MGPGTAKCTQQPPVTMNTQCIGKESQKLLDQIRKDSKKASISFYHQNSPEYHILMLFSYTVCTRMLKLSSIACIYVYMCMSFLFTKQGWGDCLKNISACTRKHFVKLLSVHTDCHLFVFFTLYTSPWLFKSGFQNDITFVWVGLTNTLLIFFLSRCWWL